MSTEPKHEDAKCAGKNLFAALTQKLLATLGFATTEKGQVVLNTADSTGLFLPIGDHTFAPRCFAVARSRTAWSANFPGNWRRGIERRS